MELSALSTLYARSIAWLRAHPAGTQGHWIALFGDELLAVQPTLQAVMVILERTPLPGKAFVHRLPGVPWDE